MSSVADPAPAAHAAPVRYAGAWRRFMGIVYECVILFAVVFFFGYAFSALTQFKGAPGWGRHALQAWIYLVLAAYFVYFWSRGRRSLPMKTLELRITDSTGRPLGPGRALARYCAASLCLLTPLAAAQWLHVGWAALLLAPFATVFFDARRRTLYDIVSGTVLTIQDLPKPARSPRSS